jgi:hypothetical protein
MSAADTEVTPIATLDVLVAELTDVLERARAVQLGGPSAAAVNPDGTPGNVVAGELIESAWGNSVANTFVARKLGQVSAGRPADAAVPVNTWTWNFSLVYPAPGPGKLFVMAYSNMRAHAGDTMTYSRFTTTAVLNTPWTGLWIPNNGTAAAPLVGVAGVGASGNVTIEVQSIGQAQSVTFLTGSYGSAIWLGNI